MADTVTVTTIRDSGSELVVHITGVSDGSGESDAIKVDKSAFTVSGAEPGSLTLMEADGQMSGYAGLTLEWDRGTDVKIFEVAPGSFYKDFRPDGKRDSGSGGTGDVVLTTTSPTSGGRYDITLRMRKE